MLDLCGQQSRSAEQRSGELLDEGVDMVDDKLDKEEEWEVVVVFGLERKGNKLLDDRLGLVARLVWGQRRRRIANILKLSVFKISSCQLMRQN